MKALQTLSWIMAMAGKEGRHILRDWQTLGILLTLPVFMMFFFGYALNADVEEVPIAIIDPMPSAESQILISALKSSELFHVVSIQAAGKPIPMMIGQRAKAVVRFPADLSASLLDRGAHIQVLIDGSDPSTGTFVRNSIGPFFQNQIQKLLGKPVPKLVEITPLMLYNPEQKSSLFFVPGLMATLLLMVGALMTSVAIVREKESGTLANLLVSPVGPALIIIGKVLPFFLIAGFDAVLIMVVGHFVFHVPIQGSLWLLAMSSVLYILVALSLGLLISTMAHRQEHAMMIALASTMMPTIMLSGFVFPVSSMPIALQWLSTLMPARWYLQVVRGIVLKGVGLAELWHQLLILSGMGIVLLTISIKRFHTRG